MCLWVILAASFFHPPDCNRVESRLVAVSTCSEIFMALSFAKDIRPLFRDAPDVDSMKKYGSTYRPMLR
jgi:hypothetical protein